MRPFQCDICHQEFEGPGSLCEMTTRMKPLQLFDGQPGLSSGKSHYYGIRQFEYNEQVRTMREPMESEGGVHYFPPQGPHPLEDTFGMFCMYLKRRTKTHKDTDNFLVTVGEVSG
jgi:hypothetical protein